MRVIKFAVAKSTIILTLTALTPWVPAEAQQPPAKAYRIGFLRAVACIRETDLFLGLRELGYTEGQNLVIECRHRSGGAPNISSHRLHRQNRRRQPCSRNTSLPHIAMTLIATIPYEEALAILGLLVILLASGLVPSAVAGLVAQS